MASVLVRSRPLLLADRFARANSSTVLGSTDDGGILGSTAWTQQMGGTGWGINSSAAFTPAGAGLPRLPVATVDLGTGDVDLSVLFAAAGNQGGLVFRYVDDSNFWMALNWTTSPQLFLAKVVAGVQTQVGSGFPAMGSGHTQRVVAIGSTIVVFEDAGIVASVTDAFNVTATKHGLCTSNEFVGGNGGDAAVRFQNWQGLPA